MFQNGRLLLTCIVLLSPSLLQAHLIRTTITFYATEYVYKPVRVADLRLSFAGGQCSDTKEESLSCYSSYRRVINLIQHRTFYPLSFSYLHRSRVYRPLTLPQYTHYKGVYLYSIKEKRKTRSTYL